MIRQSLNGTWTFQRVDGPERGTAAVPGDIYRDLLENRLIPDPFHRDNELALQWIGESPWTFSRDFDLPDEMVEGSRLILRCLGLDTLATLLVNGTEVGAADNMFRTWEWDIQPFVHPGSNSISIRFDSILPYIGKRQAERPLPWWGGDKVACHGWVRKEACNGGWDWGLRALTCGIWRDIEILAPDTGRILDVNVRQDHDAGAVRLLLEVETEFASACSAKAVIRLDGNEVLTRDLNRTGASELILPDPQLWWPNNLGAQPLYELEVQLLLGGHVVDRCLKRIGLRTLRLDRHADEWGESFQFVVNGIPFFAKGANWIPADGILSRVTDDQLRGLVRAAVGANMNMLRVWGGGIYEDDAFYDACDELGICVWQDFMFACATYPTFDETFMASVRAEAVDNIKRLRHHPCLALWCGNNELEQGLVAPEWNERSMSWEDYSRLFDHALADLVATHAPQTDYWPGSPHTPIGDRTDYNDPTCGDAHLWSVWHGKEPFEWYRTCEHRFNSEFGFQSFPEPKTVHGYTEPGDRNVTSWVMEHHQRSGIGNTTILQYMLDWFRLPEGFDNTLWTSQILQGMAIKYACEHWRRSMPRGMGTLYWQLNDTWPVASWSSIDYHHRWKALHYMARDFFAPLLISGLEDLDTGQIEIHVTSDRLQACGAEVSWSVTDLGGKVLQRDSLPVQVPASTNTLVHTLDLQDHLRQQGHRNLLVWLELKSDHGTSENLVLFSRPKHLDLLPPTIRYDVTPLDGSDHLPSRSRAKGGTRPPGAFVQEESVSGAETRPEVGFHPTGTDNDSTASSAELASFRVALTCEHPALWTWLELTDSDAAFSANFIHLRPGKFMDIVVTPNTEMTTESFRDQLRVRSLVDTYTPKS